MRRGGGGGPEAVEPRAVRRDFRFFLLSVLAGGFAAAVVDAVLNNHLRESFRVTDLHRSLIEIPREVPGLAVIFVWALLFAFCSRRLAAMGSFLIAAGALGIGFLSPGLGILLGWLFVLSLGQHLVLGLHPAIALELAEEGAEGRLLGRLNGARNAAAILGSLAVFAGFRYADLGYTGAFALAALVALGGAFLMLGMRPLPPHPPGAHLALHREYGLYYWLTILYGTRKQIFLTFAPWVLVTVHQARASTVALLLGIGGAAGIVFQPLLGRAVDHFGERAALMGEAAALVAVCLGYALAGTLLPPAAAFLLTAACYVADQLLMSVGMARATWLKKIARDPAHVAPTLTMAVSLDHVFSIGGAVAAGFVWDRFGYRPVFAAAAALALVNLLSASFIRLPATRRAPTAAGS
jgi:predicted MFS family arabinose efflux permease